MNVASSPHRPHPWRLQFSLRLLLLAFTAFAIGFPLWYRWPYEESEMNRTGTTTRITTWQRQWGGGRRHHGLQRQITNGKTIESLVYRDGLRHGPYESTTDRGQFVNDKREGIWTAPDRTMTWCNGKLDGPSEIRLPPATPPRLQRKPGKQTSSPPPPPEEPRIFKLIFVEGHLTEMNGKPAANRLFDALETDAIDERTRNELDKTTMIDVVEMPLKDIALYLSDLHAIPIVLDPKLGPNYDVLITNTLNGIDLCSALLLLTAPHGLGCDYRYGCIWITTAEDCHDWRDPTGVSDIKPLKDSALARVWNEAAPPVKAVNVPLADILVNIQQPLAIEIDTSRIQHITKNWEIPLVRPPPVPNPPVHVTALTRGLPLKHVFGQLLYRANCRCQLEGDKLIVLPPEDNETKP